MYIYTYIYLSIYLSIYLGVSQPLVGLIPAPHARTHTDGGRLTPGGIGARASGGENPVS